MRSAAETTGASTGKPVPPLEVVPESVRTAGDAGVDEAFLRQQGAEITRASGSNFVLSFLLLGRERRRGMEALYAFCRAVDDAVDEAPDTATAAAGIAFWRDEVTRIEDGTEPSSPLGRELAWAVGRFGIRIDRLRALIDGCAMDLDPTPFADADALDHYCWHVASAVGLSCLPVFGAVEPGEPGADTKAAEEYAEKLGLALQWTNILRDLKSDALEGRVYVPTSELEQHGVERDWLRGDGPAEAYADGGPVHRLVDSMVARARRRFAEARAAKPRRFRRALVPAEVMGAVYRDLLARVCARKGRIDGPRPRVPKSTRVRCLLGVLTRSLIPGAR